ncbi:chemotaxis protein CheW [Zavarzinia sp. CC-PAN008]|uniref:chemotaxis protein CheW n=1 Tax=Zavarzinia sp. CC-PAN008 TaxID=3243332 RepID=UPI003F749EAE
MTETNVLAERQATDLLPDWGEVLMLGLGGEVFALDARIVQEILDVVAVTEVPGARPFVRGVINVRGKVVPLADLRLRFGMAATEATIDSRIVVVEVELDGDPTLVGLLADKVFEVTGLPRQTLEPTPRIGMRWKPEFIRCVGRWRDRFVIVPDLVRILA